MKITKLRLAIIILLLITSSLYLYLFYYSINQSVPEKTVKVINYSFTVRNKSSEFIKDTPIEIFLPISKSSYQRVSELSISRQFTIENYNFSNQSAIIQLTLPPFATEVFSVEVTLELQGQPDPINEDDLQVWLNPERFIESDDNKLKEIANKLIREERIQSANEIFKFTAAHIKDLGYVRDNYGALHALNYGTGDCTEFAYLFVAIARAAGIPARPIGGFYLDSRARFRSEDYHNWAEFYDGQAWWIVDPMFQNFMNNGANYVAFRVLGGSRSQTERASQRFMAYEERLEISLN